MSGWHGDEVPGDGLEPLPPIFGPAIDGSSGWLARPDAEGLAQVPKDERVFGWGDGMPDGPAEPVRRPRRDVPAPTGNVPEGEPLDRPRSPSRSYKRRRSAARLVAGLLTALVLLGAAAAGFYLLAVYA